MPKQCLFTTWGSHCSNPANDEGYCKKHDVECTIPRCSNHASTGCGKHSGPGVCGRELCEVHADKCPNHAGDKPNAKAAIDVDKNRAFVSRFVQRRMRERARSQEDSDE